MASITELFLDDHLIEMVAGVRRRMHRPRKHLLNPILRPEKWWEGNQLLPYATLYDAEEKLFKLWCRCGSDFREHYVADHAAYSAYYTSTDGIHWDRPMLGVTDLGGRKDHNVVFVGDRAAAKHNNVVQGNKGFIVSVVRHPHPKDEGEKYVGLAFSMKRRGARLGTSPDGIHWHFDENPFWQTHLDVASWGDDALIQLIYDKAKKKWVVYRRVIPQEGERMMAAPGDENSKAVDRYVRIFSYTESENLKDWGNYRVIVSMDADDPVNSDVYNLSCMNYEQVYVGYMSVYYAVPGAENIDVQLITSRNGTDFSRVCRREVFIPSGDLGYFDYMVMTGFQPEPLIVDDTVYIYYEGVNYPHNVECGDNKAPQYTGTAMGLATFKRDRFVSMEAATNDLPCRFATKPFVVRHPNLFLNAATWGSGSIRVEALGRDWKPIEGFLERDSIPIQGNALSHPVRWRENGGLGRLVGKEIRLKFYMSDARIHAMTQDENDRKLGQVFTSENPEQITGPRPGAERGEI
jgi:hypothetical protein